MSLELPSVESVAKVWYWARQYVELWVRAISDLRGLLSGYDLEAEKTLTTALQFSLFAVILAILVDVPLWVLYQPKALNLAHLILRFILYYVTIGCFVVAQRLASILLRGRASLRACLITTLFGTAYWPINNVTDYLISDNRHRAAQVFSYGLGDMVDIERTLAFVADPKLVVWLICVSAIGLFVLFRFTAAARLVHHVGTLRGVTICFITLFLGSALDTLLLQPLTATMYGVPR
jgi:hypothetical protein